MCDRRKESGFTLIELLIVVAIIGIIAAIAIPNLLNAVQRGKQKRTMSDIRTIATAVESYGVDNGFPPTVASGAVSTLSTVLQPTFVKRVPPTDGWKSAFQWVHVTSGPGSSQYTLVSYGKDGSSGAYIGGPTTDFNSDIYYSDGSFIQWPEGTQN